MPHLDSISESAGAVGAVNTVVFRDGCSTGDNTDWWGFRESLRRGLSDAPLGRVLLLGAGGAGGAVAQALADEGTGEILVHDIDHRRATVLAERLGIGRARVVDDLAEAAASADGIVNTTPVGMAKLPGLPLPEALVDPRHWVADIVYFPLETELLTLARGRGCRVLPGSGMALYQAVRAFELFTGRRPDPDRMWAAFEAAG
jgi:shikimate dehydrogenase